MSERGIDVSHMPVSHLCYRTATLEEYEEVRDRLQALSRAVAEGPFNGRPISMLLLKEPLPLAGGSSVPLIELPAPKPSRTYPSGFEHLGLVAGARLEEFRERYRHVLSGVKDRGPYCRPSFIAFEDGKTVKFYERTLEEVVRLEGWTFEAP